MILIDNSHSMPLKSHNSSRNRNRNRKKYIVEEYIPPNSKTTEELVAERLSLGNSAKTSVINFLGVKLHAVLRELEPLLYQ